MSTVNEIRSYYFNPFTQTYSGEEEESSVHITLDASKEFSPDELAKVIKIYGNWLALNSIDYQSGWIHNHKCNQSGTECSQRHLSAEEIEECHTMKRGLIEQGFGGTHRGTSLYVQDVDCMRRVLGCVRDALQVRARSAPSS